MRFGPIFPLIINLPRTLKPCAARAFRTPLNGIRGSNQEWDMDLVMAGLTVAFFALAFAYIQTCSKL